MKKILYVGNFEFPDGNASGKRVYANGKLLEKLGYEVVYIGLKRNIENKNKLAETEYIYDGFKSYNFRYPTNKISWLNYNKKFQSLIELIDTKIDPNTIEMIIYYGSPSLSFFITKLIKYANSNRIKIISDCVDWLTVKTNNPFFDLIKWLDTTYQKAYINKKADGIIAISTYLKEYYEQYERTTVLIPPLTPVEMTKYVNNSNQNMVIVYAGTPFRKGQKTEDTSTLKDRIDIAIQLLSEAKGKGMDFIFNVFGFTEAEYLESIPNQRENIEKLSTSIVFHGMRPNSEVVKEISKADFTILIRDVNRDTSAGFPTKISESISYGTPVITTKTSDIENYVQESKNGFFLTGNMELDIKKLVSILEIRKNEIKIMKSYCIEENPFLYSKYINITEEFIKNIKNY